MIVLPHIESTVPQIFGFEINGHDRCPYCGFRLQSIALIAQGRQTSPARWPWHAALFYQESFNLNYKCGASIIRNNIVITAAHCVTRESERISENIMKIRIEQGELLSSSSHQFNVFKSSVHEKYNHQTFENDIALLLLESKIEFTTRVQAICLPQVEIPNQGIGTVVGFGSTDKSTDHSNVLREAEIPIVSHEVCLDSDPSFFSKHLFLTNFCAGKIGVQKGVCQGDSGGCLIM
jgi:secreted trypsin-like serine protease